MDAMSVHELRRDAPPSWWTDALRHMSEPGPVSVADLAAAVGRDTSALERMLRESPVVHETADGWVDLLTLADGAVFTHTVRGPELETGRLFAEEDLLLWARLADAEGLPLRGGGRLRPEWTSEEPFEGTVLAGPDGWLAGFEPEDVVALRLRDGLIDVSVTTREGVVTKELAERVTYVIKTCVEAAMAALYGFAEDVADDPDVLPAAPVDEILADILVDRPETFADPLPPLTETLLSASMELSEGLVGIAGTPWSPDDVVGLTPEDIVGFTPRPRWAPGARRGRRPDRPARAAHRLRAGPRAGRRRRGEGAGRR